LLSLQLKAPEPAHEPLLLHVSIGVHRLLSVHDAPASVAEPTLLQAPVVVLQVSSVHGLLSLHVDCVSNVQLPPEQRSPVVHALPSLQALVLSTVYLQPTALSQASSVHALLSLHTSAGPAVHAPLPLQVSVVVHSRPSLQAVPAARLVFLQPPSWSHVSVVHALLSLQFTPVPAQTPLVQLSALVQSLPSLQVVPLATLVKTQPPEPQLSVVHGLPSLHARAPLPTQPPEPLQVSVVVQTLPSLHTTPDATLVYWHPPVGLQVSVVQAWLSLQTTA
jgi:hypothetical protein